MGKNCIDIVRPFFEVTDELRNLQMIGGIGSYVLQNPLVEILPDEKIIYAPPSMDMSGIGQFRADGNKRDFDLLVKTTDAASIKNIKDAAKDTIGDELLLSVFGLRTISELQRQRDNPYFSLAKEWVGDRYAEESGGEITRSFKALFPFAVDMDLESLENWNLVIGRTDVFPVPHPGTVILNYRTRSISGLRPKDASKVGALSRNIFNAAPEIAEWINDGPGSSQLDLARILHSLRNPKRAAHEGRLVEIRPYDNASLATHPAMLMEKGQASAVNISKIKAKALHAFERQDWIVTYFQRYLEKYFSFIVGNS